MSKEAHGRAFRRCLLLLVVASSCIAAVAAVAGDQGGELGILFGGYVPDRDLSGRPTTFDNAEPIFGIRGDYWFAPRVGWLVDSTFSVFETANPGGDATLYNVRTGFEFLHQPHWTNYQTFCGVGGGWLGSDLELGEDFTRWFASASAGQRFGVGANQLLRWELRADHTLTDDGLGGRDLTTGYLLLGYTWGMPSRALDTDGDGVADRLDACPRTPAGARVDSRGCPLDGDADRVPDGLDRCPDTSAGWPVDEYGCPLDSDGDGVPDGVDHCAGTPPATPVDERGCPADSDGDGVLDPADKCPGTPHGARVDLNGCPVDGDEDGVADGIDECPATPRYAHVDARGCPMDTDHDGVYDGLDRCPQTPSGVQVDAAGCPVAKPLFEEQRRTLVLEGVHFEHDSATLGLNSRKILDGVATSLLAWPEVRVEVGGHTDSTGKEAYNLELSRRRAEAVRDYLVGKGVPSAQLTAQGYGETHPIEENSTPEGRAKNRRVELKRLD